MFARLFKSSKPWEEFEAGRKAWSEFSAREQEQIINAYMPKVRFLAQQQKKRVPVSIEANDLVSAGVLGLMEALGKYRPETGYAFSTYAEARINGAMLDEMRRRDPLSRSTRNMVKAIMAASEKFEHKKGRKPSEKELVKLTGLSLAEVRTGLQAMEQQITTDMSLLAETLSNEALESGGTPYRQAIRNEIVAHIRSCLEELSERDQFILSMYYLEEYSLREIATALKVSEGRVSQLRSQAQKRLHDLYVARFGTR
ncbi:MAG TPA: FliA/WhiG family RNA polymerase sigma factor [Candidatus Desulfovibrio intestinipullorum]|uniref:FliA/WhiG family RNA polymerase sigma factor n=1 Tax=Candidatus Desulfovibrio intestinipullorum TaxID=2838536 RepID=A0A9D1TPN4_9BACT|nr:FliA/WhiG family RNA polymerase sigma factor [Candidatus Desulfovibrio intestinipullorum]